MTLTSILKTNNTELWIEQLLNQNKSSEQRQELMKVNSTDVVKSEMGVIRYSEGVLKSKMQSSLYNLIVDYIEVYFSGTNSKLVAQEFVDIIFTDYYLWNPLDFQGFVNFIKKNKPETSGHKISPVELIQSVELWEGKKCEIIEQENKKYKSDFSFHPEVASKLKTVIKPVSQGTGALSEKDLMEVQKRNQNKKPYEPNVSESALTGRNSALERKAEHDRLKSLVETKQITEQEMLIEYDKFLKK